MTEEEYNRLRDASEGLGARSVSEFVRNALLTTPDPDSAAKCSHIEVSILGERIAKVEQDVAQVRNELSVFLGSAEHKAIT